MAIGKPELADAPDDELLLAHDKHLALCQQMLASEDHPESTIPRGMPASAKVPNEAPKPSIPKLATNLTQEQRSAQFQALVNEAVHRQGIPIADAVNQVMVLHPELHRRAELPAKPTQKQKNEEENRRNAVMALINEKAEHGMEYDAAFASVQRERPDLFNA
jgi:hypothetical protein